MNKSSKIKMLKQKNNKNKEVVNKEVSYYWMKSFILDWNKFYYI